jgi:hypothetical protein
MKAASYTAPLSAADTRTAVGLATANLDTQFTNIHNKTTNLPASPAAVGSAMTLTAAYDAAKTAASAADVNAQVVDVLRVDLLPDSYSAHEAQPTIAQAILAIHQFLFEREVSGTTMTIQKPDGTTTAITVTLDSDTDPTTTHRSA